ncbi:O-antigen ligase family protein [Xanthobacter dioxanivorans]|uniref:O-antigen ligase family protein n=1 Tax=Xanthobacter dioxanivorans TaxID=2528964 RepID=A0A974PLP5_9HYPH|nr:O-antigen ligase family protein [Xanthobacter dioxanivorans]QRG05908.1 O-antigen ligase family protein [Xanthobacter dioxanivorans]
MDAVSTGASDAAPAVTPAPARSTRKRSLLDRVAFGLFLVMVFFAPVPDGSVAFFWVEIWAAVAALVLLLASYRYVGRGHVLLLAGLVLVLAVYGLVALLQSISPGPSPLAIWAKASELLNIPLAPLSGSIVMSPLQFLGRPLLAALVLVAGIVLGCDSQRANVLLRMVVYAACIFGLIGYAGKLLSVEGMTPFNQGGALTAFFINKNTTATYLGSAFLAALAMLMAPFIRRIREGYPLLGEGAGKALSGAFGIAIAAVLLLLLLPLTQSRAGLLLTVLIAAAAIGWRIRLQGRALGAAAIGGVVLLAVVLASSGDVWRLRQARLNVETDGRWQAYALMWDAIAQRPALGYGLGSFEESFPQFRDANLETSGRFNIGHSTPIELAFEGGLPLALVVVGFVLLLCGVLVRGAIRRPSDPYILAALLVGLLGVLHSSVDFSLQITGYLIVCLAVVGFGLGRAFLPREDFSRRRLRRVRRHPGAEGAEETGAVH